MTHHNLNLMVKTPSTEDYIKDELIITTTTTSIVLDVMHIIKLADKIFEVALVKVRAVYNKLMNMRPHWGKRIL